VSERVRSCSKQKYLTNGFRTYLEDRCTSSNLWWVRWRGASASSEVPLRSIFGGETLKWYRSVVV